MGFGAIGTEFEIRWHGSFRWESVKSSRPAQTSKKGFDSGGLQHLFCMHGARLTNGPLLSLDHSDVENFHTETLPISHLPKKLSHLLPTNS